MPAILEKPKVVRKSSTEAARQMFLYGEGDGVRIVDVKELAQKTGASVQTIRMRVPEWNAELESILSSSSKLASPNILSLPEETFAENRDDVSFTRRRLDEVKAEIESLGETISKLESLVDTIAQQADKPDAVIALFDRYLRLCMNRKSLIRLFTDLKKLWDEKVGLDSLKAIQEATGKAASVAALKQQDPSPEPSSGGSVGGGIFSKR